MKKIIALIFLLSTPIMFAQVIKFNPNWIKYSMMRTKCSTGKATCSLGERCAKKVLHISALNGHNGCVVGKKKKWTLVFYMNANVNGVDLTSSMLADLENLKKGGSNVNANIIALFDGRNSKETKLYYIGDGFKTQLIGEEYDGRKLNLGDSFTLQSLMSVVSNKYPAEKYLLSINSHGLGFKGIAGIDVVGGTFENMMEHINLFLGKKLDVLHFDACLMGMWELGQFVKDEVNYMVASEESLDVNAHNFASFLKNTSFLKDSGKTVCKNLVNSVHSNIEQMGCIDLNQQDHLTIAINNFAKVLKNHIYNNDTDWLDEGEWSYQYFDAYELRDLIMYDVLQFEDSISMDLGDFAKEIINYGDYLLQNAQGEPWEENLKVTVTNVTEAAEKLILAINAAVVENVTADYESVNGISYKNAHGIGIFPRYSSIYEFSTDSDWLIGADSWIDLLHKIWDEY